MEIAPGGASDASSLVEASVGAGEGSGVAEGGPDEAALEAGEAGGPAELVVGAPDEAQLPVARASAATMKLMRILIMEHGSRA